LADRLTQFRDALALYRRHGWTLARVLMTPRTLADLSRAAGSEGEPARAIAREITAGADEADPGGGAAAPAFEGVAARASEVDAMWLRRPSAGGREAWELRLISDPPYALFELFEPGEPEEEREDVRREMEARIAEYAGGGRSVEGETGKG
jgi:hypothetical protein